MQYIHYLRVSCVSVAFLMATLAGNLARAAERVFFLEPLDKAEVTSPVTVRFGLEGMRIAPLRDKTPGTGHHHLIIDGEPVPKGEPIDVDETHIHYGTGLTSARIDLPPGPHKLTLQFGNGRHESYGPEMSSTINITVKPQ
ncbi:DUF4399 domain-containing protein [Rhodoferax sp. GW822-FHT02A01]|uniref:DUF4399 domain-containing protein n=1 Tax=Rhodoferax sp. GW822-FHT02A01 TaxID=3141537 RepID=UPI00315C7B72